MYLVCFRMCAIWIVNQTIRRSKGTSRLSRTQIFGIKSLLADTCLTGYMSVLERTAHVDMTASAAAMGAGFVAALWILSALAWPKTLLVKVLIRTMASHERKDILQFLKQLDHPDSAEQDDGQESHWDLVSTPPNSQSPPSPHSSEPGPILASAGTCQHVFQTRKGTNGYQKRRSCKTCGELLSVEKVAVGSSMPHAR